MSASWTLTAMLCLLAAWPGLAQSPLEREPPAATAARSQPSGGLGEAVVRERARAQGPLVWFTAAQTGLADTFQLTLGGTFGDGPAWQNRVTTGVANVFRGGDSLSVYGWNTLDTPSRSYDWQAGVGYKLPVWKMSRHLLSVGSGLQRWLLPSVKSGANDWLIPGNLVYQTAFERFSFTVTGDSWTLLTSPLPRGSLLHAQTWLQCPIVRREDFSIAFKHGPAHTYSWNFYGTNGHRVIRYQAMLVVNYKSASIEGGYRKQWGLQTGIPDNEYWQVSFTQTFSRPLH